MEQLLIYLLKSSALLSIFLLAYQFLLRNDTSFQVNRIFLLAGILASLLLPLVEFNRVVEIEAQAFQMPFPTAIPITEVSDTQQPAIDWWLIGGIIYSLGLSFFLLRMLIQVFSLLKIFRNGTRTKEGPNMLIHSDEQVPPFSFFRNIVVNPVLHSEEELRIIIRHEQVHASQWHSADVLFSNLTAAILWFNPLSWWYKNSLVQNLEYIADKGTVAASVPKKAYQYTLVKFSVACYQPALANNFYQSLIKKRIIMLNKKPTPNFSLIKITAVIPFICAFMFFFNVRTQAQVASINITGSSGSNASANTTTQANPSGNLLDKVGMSPLYIIRNRHYTTAELAGKTILLQGVFNVLSKEEALEKYGSSAKDGVIIITKGKIIDDFKASLKNIDEKDLPVRKYYIQVLEGAKPIYLDLKKTTETETLSGPTAEMIQASAGPGKSIRVIQTDSIRPLYILDGEVLPADFDLNTIDPDDIATINVLKGENATQAYGEKGKNGVIQINLKGRVVLNEEILNNENIIYVLNGKVMDAGFKAYEVKAENIKTVHVIKGDAAIEKYGEKAKEGVIEIITKDKE